MLMWKIVERSTKSQRLWLCVCVYVYIYIYIYIYKERERTILSGSLCDILGSININM